MLDFVNQEQGGSVNQALSQAHFRTSSKEHDKIFSLANIFHEMFEDMGMDYEMDTKTTFDHFYRTVATNDLSILCFGSNLVLNGPKPRENTMKNHQLPSWTGVSGHHIHHYVTTTTALIDSYHSISSDMKLYIPTKYYKKLTLVPSEYGGFSPLSGDEQHVAHHVSMYKKRGTSVGFRAIVEEDNALLDWAIKMETVSTRIATHYHQPPNTSVMQTRPLSLTEDCEESLILPILFKSYFQVLKEAEESMLLKIHSMYRHFYYLPVFKRCGENNSTAKEERYKAIGIYLLGCPEYGEVGSDDPNEILRSFFGDDNDAVHDEVKEFIIE
ncbi:hypothetical protein BDA99DRAFT_511999 [Phascolomyces articulosus]|uniref:Uncharacterized protein n=1 Tax=Phascolomyces articulosus TaxID=60185 RepID=A0AAD5PD97_9FUNG|nr:hypothetical protein BDA99DRAFT_511999 [Phascolomyces articulosus]